MLFHFHEKYFYAKIHIYGDIAEIQFFSMVFLLCGVTLCCVWGGGCSMFISKQSPLSCQVSILQQFFHFYFLICLHYLSFIFISWYVRFLGKKSICIQTSCSVLLLYWYDEPSKFRL